MSIKLTSLIDPARDQRSETEGQSRDYRYAIEDRCLTGPTFWMGESAWGNNGISPGYLPIGMAISIRPTNSPIADARMTPTFDPAIQARICALADKIEAAWITPAIAAQRKQTAEFQERFSSSLERLQKRDLRHRKWCGIFRRILGL